LRKEAGEVYRRTENREGEFVFERSEARAKQKKKRKRRGEEERSRAVTEREETEPNREGKQTGGGEEDFEDR
jgi:hypothetical protein